MVMSLVSYRLASPSQACDICALDVSKQPKETSGMQPSSQPLNSATTISIKSIHTPKHPIRTHSYHFCTAAKPSQADNHRNPALHKQQQPTATCGPAVSRSMHTLLRPLQ